MSFSPRLIGTERADISTLEDFLSFKKFKGKKDQAFARALWEYITDKKDGTYHFWTIDEQDGYPEIRNRCNDALKFLNVYGWMICGQHAINQHAIFTKAGYRHRMVGITGHMVGEVFYKNGWHLIDMDMHSYYLNKKGVIASIKELTEKPDELILNNKRISKPNNLPDRAREGYRDMYKSSRNNWNVVPDWYTGMHCMDFQLRPGEMVCRDSRNSGRYNFVSTWLGFMNQYKHEFANGHGPGERYAPHRTYGNGCLSYKPDLTSRSRDVELGAWDIQGVESGPRGLQGKGYVVFRFQSPYLFTGRPAWKKNGRPEVQNKRVLHEDGPLALFKGSGEIAVDASKDGINWHEECSCRKSAYKGSLDLTEIAQGRYEFFVRIRLGRNGLLQHFRMEAPFMVAPLSLPRLKQGRNVLRLKTEDRYWLPTVPLIRRPDFRKKETVEAGVWGIQDGTIVKEGPWAKIIPCEHKDVKVTVRLDAPAGKSIAWVYAWACIAERDPKDPGMYAMLEVSEDLVNWREVIRSGICGTGNGWDTTIDSEVQLHKPLQTCYVRVTSPLPIHDIANRMHLLTGQDAGTDPVVTVQWKEGKKRLKKEVTKNFDKIVINCKNGPSDLRYEVAQKTTKE